MSNVSHVFEGYWSLPDIVFEKERDAQGFASIISKKWVTSSIYLTPTPNGLFFSEDQGRTYEEIRVGDSYVLKITLSPNDSHISVYIAAANKSTAFKVLTELEREFPYKAISEGFVPITFWTNTARGPRAFNRDIAAQPWSQVERNYPTVLQPSIKKLVEGTDLNTEGGKLILFSGPAGTGKTHLIRSLSFVWQEWADMHYVVDPGEFFGGGAEYLFEVLMAGSSDKWKLLVCEDTGELLTQDAKIHTGQALGRFLNLCDGMIGQGLRIQILLTTNEDIAKFHQAVVRPGRIAANLVFPKFPRDEASEWLGKSVDRELTLAEMYALNRGEQIPTEKRIGIV